jgi:putative PIN family toxin of toxin-antitoxin system
MTRSVLDTNQLVSALIVPHGKPAQILDQWKRFTLLISEDVLAELAKVLHYERIQRRYRDKVSDNLINAYFIKRRQISTLVETHSKVAVVQADPDDDILIACALDGDANYIVSGDRHLLSLREYRGIKVVAPNTFLSILEAQQ